MKRLSLATWQIFGEEPAFARYAFPCHMLPDLKMLSEFLDAYGFIGVLQVVSVIYGFLCTKVLALFLGPLGLGIFA